MNKRFPDNFLFGAASASYQVEGAYDKDGKCLSNWDVFSKIEGKTFEGTNGDVSVDHYHRYLEDVQLMKALGLHSYRFSISWSRIFKEDGTVNKAGVDFYHRLIDALNENGIIPFVTLYHWDLPNHFEEKGGWSASFIVDEFVKYAKVCFEEFGDKVNHFITFNEAIVFLSLGYLEAAHPPGLSDERLYAQSCHHVNLAHAKSVLLYKEMGFKGEIGITHVMSPAYPADTTKEAFQAAKWVNSGVFNWYYDPILLGEYPAERLTDALEKGLVINDGEMELLKKSAKLNDFIGVNYYQPSRVTLNQENKVKEVNRANATGGAGNISFDGKTRSVKLEDAEYTKWDWEIFPDALYEGMKEIYDRFDGIKIYITENGLGDVDPIVGEEILDQPRIDYIEVHLKAVNKAIFNGVNVGGYYAWSFTDLLSWLNGYKKQYGFVYIDHKNDLKRVKKASYHWYQKVIETKGESIL